MLEKTVLFFGALLGLGTGVAFYWLGEELRLPALLFGIVDLFGIAPAAIFVGLISFLIGSGGLVLIVDRFFPVRRDG